MIPKVYADFSNCKSSEYLNEIEFTDCYFVNVTGDFHLRTVFLLVINEQNQTTTRLHTLVFIIRCNFHHIFSVKSSVIIKCNHYHQQYPVAVFITNTSFSHLTSFTTAIYFEKVNLMFNGVTIVNIYSMQIIKTQKSYIVFHGYNLIGYNEVSHFIVAEAIYLKENVTLQFTYNSFIYVVNSEIPHSPVAYCPIQYITDTSNLDKQFLAGEELKYSVLFSNNHIRRLSNINAECCRWSSTSAFSQLRPSQVNKRFIHYINDSYFVKKRICICNNSETFDCTQQEIGPYYPGELVTIGLRYSSLGKYKSSKVRLGNVDAKYSSPVLCITNEKIKFQFEIEVNKCRNMKYSVWHTSENWCALSILVTPLPQGDRWLEMYTILLQPCPKGFSLHPLGYCQCDPILASHIPSLTTCDIDHQTIPRPANTWISAHTINNSHSYHVSLHCPFDYCLPHSSQLNLSTPDSQCQFNRSGVLCGQCQHGLSTVFGSSQCKHCSNIYLLIIIPFGIAGFILVVLLFFLNLTTTDGKLTVYCFMLTSLALTIQFFLQLIHQLHTHSSHLLTLI